MIGAVAVVVAPEEMAAPKRARIVAAAGREVLEV